jgi:hypothetical protein
MQGVRQLVCNIRGLQCDDDLYYSLPFCHRTIWRLNKSISEECIASNSLSLECRGRIFIWSLVLLNLLHCVINQRAQVAVRGCIFLWTLVLLIWAPRRQKHENRGSALFWNFYLHYLTTVCHIQEDHNVKIQTVCSYEIWSFLPHYNVA